PGNRGAASLRQRTSAGRRHLLRAFRAERRERSDELGVVAAVDTRRAGRMGDGSHPRGSGPRPLLHRHGLLPAATVASLCHCIAATRRQWRRPGMLIGCGTCDSAARFCWSIWRTMLSIARRSYFLVSIVTGGLIAWRNFWGSISIVGNAGAVGIRFNPELAV